MYNNNYSFQYLNQLHVHGDTRNYKIPAITNFALKHLAADEQGQHVVESRV